MPEGDPAYLLGPVEGEDRVEGDLDKWSVSRSLSAWLGTHPAAKAGLMAETAVGVIAALLARA